MLAIGGSRRVETARKGNVTLVPLSLYDTPPTEEVPLEDFELFAIDRQQVLRQVEEAKERGMKSSELSKWVESACAKHNLHRQSRASNKDVISHFILRLAYCRTEDLRRWFLSQESALFKCRFEGLGADEQLQFVRANSINVTQIAEKDFETYQEQLRDLHDMPGASRQHFWKVPFEDVVDLIAQRKVLLHEGDAFVPSSQLSSIVVGRFRSSLSKALVTTHKAMPAVEREEQYGAFLKSVGNVYFGPDFSSGTHAANIDINDIDMLAQRSFPMCMSHMHKKLRENHHLKHNGRLTYGLFLKGIGVTLEDAMRFWRAEFTKSMPADKFDKQYAYGIRYNYGKEGKRTDYTPYSCVKIIQGAPATGDHHGCPFRHFDSEQLTASLRKHGISNSGIAEMQGLVKNHHYQVACKRYFAFTHDNAEGERVGMHPNSYFSESMEYYKEKDVKAVGSMPTKADHTVA